MRLETHRLSRWFATEQNHKAKVPRSHRVTAPFSRRQKMWDEK
jgi:hypothetical protein